ncbi:XrtA system polysaccharide deacetylase [Lentisalinibacter salinarum]|uniref:XrtA system polysaccharide deacetylase n=1 Tax=Lentisalinibacter salinarum TaxID=2992239 RepID=UPI00386CB701
MSAQSQPSVAADVAVEQSRYEAEFPAVGRRWLPVKDELANALTCDVEDYFQVSAFEHLVPKSAWGEHECRIPRNVDRALQLYDDAGVKGTFFTLGWVAEHFPEVVRRIADAGHEVASHGMQHVRVWDQNAEDFRADISRTKKLLEDVTGQPVLGYRAASWSLDRRTPWAHQIMAEEGYRYSSSIYPIAHDHYGLPDAPVWPFYVRGCGLLEIPASAPRLLGRNLPAAGGGYFRLLPLAVSRWLVNRVRNANRIPAIFYFHPWELDPDQPRMPGITLKTRFRHYLNLHRFEGRLVRLLKELPWDRMDRIYLEAV